VSKDRRLGRGLAALLGSPLGEHDGVSTAATLEARERVAHDALQRTKESSNSLSQLNVFEIDDNPYQPRRDFNEQEIAELAESLKTHDMLQPILVRQVGERYQLISGERRLRAAILAGWKTVPVRVREADDQLVAELAIVENLQRKDLNPIEKAMSFKRYIDEHRCSQDFLASRLQVDRSHVANLLRLLELPTMIVEALRDGKLSPSHAKALLPVGDEQLQIQLAQKCIEEEISLRDLEQLVQMELLMEDAKTAPITKTITKHSEPKVKTKRSEHLASLEQEFRKALGAKIEFVTRSNDKGRIVIHYSNQEEFARIREHITGVKSRRAAG
jgi:ParB family chromosome partitioning protein